MVCKSLQMRKKRTLGIHLFGVYTHLAFFLSFRSTMSVFQGVHINLVSAILKSISKIATAYAVRRNFAFWRIPPFARDRGGKAILCMHMPPNFLVNCTKYYLLCCWLHIFLLLMIFLSKIFRCVMKCLWAYFIN